MFADSSSSYLFAWYPLLDGKLDFEEYVLILKALLEVKAIELAGTIGQSKLFLLQGDITRQETDVIVNAANSGLLGGGGVDGAIHRAGGPGILEECKKILSREGPCKPGRAVITGGGMLKAKWVVHAVGPIWRGGNSNESAILASAYRNSLELAHENGAKSISFPSISTGAYGYPVQEAAQVALSELRSYMQSNMDAFEQICFVLFDVSSYKAYKDAAAGIFRSS